MKFNVSEWIRFLSSFPTINKVIFEVARLRDKLGRERTLREQADMLNDDDIEHLIKYLNAGGTLAGMGMVAPANQAANSMATNAQNQQNNDMSMHLI